MAGTSTPSTFDFLLTHEIFMLSALRGCCGTEKRRGAGLALLAVAQRIFAKPLTGIDPLWHSDLCNRNKCSKF